jgi:hypothetical protein
MTKNPLINAGLAAIYIGGLVLLIGMFERMVPGPDTLLTPIIMLSVLVLSVLVMGYLLVLAPLTLFLDGKRTEAVKLFGYTTLSFALITVALLSALLYAARL